MEWMTDLFGDKPLTNRGDRLNPDSTWNHSPSGRTRGVEPLTEWTYT